MALATTALSEAKAKLEAAQSEGQWQVGRAYAQDALKAAAEALVSARRSNDVETKLQALEVVVQANIISGDMFAANLAATDELAMIRRAGDKTAEARALQLLSDVHLARGDATGAASSLQSALELQRELGDKAGQAKTLQLLAMAKLGAGKKNDALAPAQDAVKLFEEVGDKEGESRAKRCLSQVFAEKNQLDKAPNRSEALKALGDLSSAVEMRDSHRWQEGMKELDRTGAYVQKDVDDIVSTALEKDRLGAAAFLEEQGIVVKGSGAPQIQMNEYPKTLQYIHFRLGGLGYGPRFRCLNSYKKQVTGDPTSLGALACLQVAEDADDWEVELQFHPGVLDGMLQSNAAYGGAI